MSNICKGGIYLPVPESFRERCDRLLPGGYQAFFSQNLPLYRGLTVNTLRCTPEHFAAIAPFAVEPSGFCPANFRLKEPNVKLGHHPYHHAGVYYVQEPSASAPANLLGVQPGDKVLDLCAAPGGKSAQLAAALAGSGVLYANEVMPDRAHVLCSNLERMGVTNAVVLNDTAKAIADGFCEYFDKILVDAPCSGEGMFRKEQAAVAQYSQRLVESCAATARQLLDTIAAALRPGGVLVFSTCTFSPEEDEGTVGWFLDRHPEFELLDTGVLFGTTGHESCCVEGKVETEKLRRIYPVHGGEGHFMAKMRKRGQQESVPLAQKFLLKGEKLPKDAQAFFNQLFPSLVHGAFLEGRQGFYLLPQQEIYLPRGLHLLRAGVAVGQLQKGRFEPHHHLFNAYGTVCANAEKLSAQEERCSAYLRGEELAAQNAQNGFCAVLADGFCMGFGKVSGGRLKNRYPKGLRNLK